MLVWVTANNFGVWNSLMAWKILIGLPIESLFENNMQRYTFNATLKWNVTDWLTLSGRVRTDNTRMNYTRKIYASSNTLFASEYGNYLNHTMSHNNLYADALLSIDKSFSTERFPAI